jgi:hypothetical protein
MARARASLAASMANRTDSAQRASRSEGVIVAADPPGGTPGLTITPPAVVDRSLPRGPVGLGAVGATLGATGTNDLPEFRTNMNNGRERVRGHGLI